MWPVYGGCLKTSQQTGTEGLIPHKEAHCGKRGRLQHATDDGALPVKTVCVAFGPKTVHQPISQSTLNPQPLDP